jgi:hypothetical protein
MCRFKEEIALEERMQGIAGVIEQCGYPDFILLQVGLVGCGRQCVQGRGIRA